jgi:hypothetical protein
MSVKDPAIPRGKMSPQERRLRSELNRLVSQHGVLHGALIHRRRKCGRPGCRCAQGEGHDGLYLVVTEKGESRQLYVPKESAPTVERWIAAYQQARQLLDGVSKLHWEKVRRREH